MTETYPCGCSATGPAVPTYCPTHDYFETNCAGAKCVATTTGCQKGHCQLKNFNPATGQFTLMTDQGSVATDMRERCARVCGVAAKSWRSVPIELNPFAVIRAEECESLEKQIRALPDQKD